MFVIKESKKEALSKLRGRWKTPVLLTLVIGAITLGLSFPGIIANMRLYYAEFASRDFVAMAETAQRPVSSGLLEWIFQMIAFLITAAISIAVARFYLSVIDNPEKTGFDTFFEGLTYYGRGILASFWMNLWLSLWSALFFGIFFVLAIVFAAVGAAGSGLDVETFFAAENRGLLAVFFAAMLAWFAAFLIVVFNRAYAYSQMLFIQAEYPTAPVTKTLKASIAMTKGCRGKLFLLDLSFIGWGLLAALTLGIGTLWLSPYVSSTRAVVYRRLKARAFEDGLFVTAQQPAIELPREDRQ
jgi:uncharacterized membrane protein